jgi:DNA-binding IscR family transcriptional regulator
VNWLKNIANIWTVKIPLKIASLIKSTRGAHGGYFLAKPPYEIKLGDIIRALEGEICIV